MENHSMEETLKAIERFIMQREKKTKQRNDIAEKLLNSHGLDANKWSLTQLHIVALVNDNPGKANNTFLSKHLGVSKPAITKAINALVEEEMVTAKKKENDQKSIYYILTNTGDQLAIIHDQMHQLARGRYNQLLNQFTNDELNTISKFLNAWSDQL